jgi:hypothetical protein
VAEEIDPVDVQARIDAGDIGFIEERPRRDLDSLPRQIALESQETLA